MGSATAEKIVVCAKRTKFVRALAALELKRETLENNKYCYKPPVRVDDENDAIINVVDVDEPLQQNHTPSPAYRAIFEVFEEWEVTKRNSIQRMALEIEDLQRLEAEVKEAESDFLKHMMDDIPSTSRAIPRLQEAPLASMPQEAPSTSKATTTPQDAPSTSNAIPRLQLAPLASRSQEAPSTLKSSKAPQTQMAPSTSTFKSLDQDSKFKSFCGGKTGKRLASSTPIEMRPLKSPKLTLAATPFTNARKSLKFQEKEKSNHKNKFVFGDANSDSVQIGPNGTMVSKAALNAINWSMAGAAVTRKILMEVFDRDTLAFHTLTGKPSPAFIDCNKPLKHQLDAAKVADIVHIMTEKLNMTAKEVRCAITTKCADENKMYRQREQKRLNMVQKIKKENIY